LIIFIVGTRPEAIKLAPVIIEAKKRHLPHTIIVTGQHDIVPDLLYEDFEIVTDTIIDLGQKGTPKSLGDLSSALFKEINAHFQRILDTSNVPSITMVQGDTLSTLVGALVSFYHQIPVAHIEAGLRSYDRYSPFPEEMLRMLTDTASTIHFCPTNSSRENLWKMGINPGNIHMVGNTVIDAVNIALEKTIDHKKPTKDFILMTMHRRENWERMVDIFNAIKSAVADRDDIYLLYPVHYNHSIADLARNTFAGHKNITICDALSYTQFIWALNNCMFVITDSGGIQEEACYLGKPLLVIREETERHESLFGTGKLIGTNPIKIKDAVSKQILIETTTPTKPVRNMVFGIGNSAYSIINILQREGFINGNSCG
jgi:UDP-N-acetylglucosamine 2-epimerase (non-hydrolysing)